MIPNGLRKADIIISKVRHYNLHYKAIINRIHPIEIRIWNNKETRETNTTNTTKTNIEQAHLK